MTVYQKWETSEPVLTGLCDYEVGGLEEKSDHLRICSNCCDMMQLVLGM